MGTTASVFICYTASIFIIAIKAYGVTHDRKGFLLSNRELPSWRAALSAGASDMSGWLLMGLPGLAFVASDEAAYLALGLAIGTWLNWKFVAARLRENTIAYHDALTLPTYFANRYQDTAQAFRIVTAITILIFYLMYLSAGMVAAAKLFVAVFDLNYLSALLIGASIVISYTMLGGFRAVVNTDALQAVMMICALAATSFLLIDTTWRSGLQPIEIVPFSGTLNVVAIVSALAWGLGYPGQPHILARFMATRNKTEIAAAGRIAVTWTFICLLAAITIGYTASLHPELGGYAGDAERIFVIASQLVFHPVIAGLVTAAILAAIMSTADSQLLVAASALYHDLFPQRAAQQSPQAWLRGIRVITGLLGIISVILAANPDSSVLGIVAYAWAGFGASFGPAIIFSLYAERISGMAVLAGMVSGAVTVVVWEIYPLFLPEIYSLIPGLAANLLITGLCSSTVSANRT